jgi:hypothetical protein
LSFHYVSIRTTKSLFEQIRKGVVISDSVSNIWMYMINNLPVTLTIVSCVSSAITVGGSWRVAKCLPLSACNWTFFDHAARLNDSTNTTEADKSSAAYRNALLRSILLVNALRQRFYCLKFDTSRFWIQQVSVSSAQSPHIEKGSSRLVSQPLDLIETSESLPFDLGIWRRITSTLVGSHDATGTWVMTASHRDTGLSGRLHRSI